MRRKQSASTPPTQKHTLHKDKLKNSSIFAARPGQHHLFSAQATQNTHRTEPSAFSTTHKGAASRNKRIDRSPPTGADSTTERPPPPLYTPPVTSNFNFSFGMHLLCTSKSHKTLVSGPNTQPLSLSWDTISISRDGPTVPPASSPVPHPLKRLARLPPTTTWWWWWWWWSAPIR